MFLRCCFGDDLGDVMVGGMGWISFGIIIKFFFKIKIVFVLLVVFSINYK